MTATEETLIEKYQREEEEAAMKLLPDEMPESREIEVSLRALPPDGQLVSPEPTRDLLDSLRTYGLMQPVVIREMDGTASWHGGKYVVLGGRRRIKAARILGWERVRATLVSGVCGLSHDSLTVGLNSTARPNVAAEMEAIRRMLAAGHGEAEISAATGLGLSTLRKRMKLLTLDVALRHALKDGRITTGAAELATKLSPEDQAELARRLQDVGRISAHDVRDLRRVRVEEATSALDLGRIDTPGIDDIDAEDSPNEPGDPNADLREAENPVTRRQVEHLRKRLEAVKTADRRTASARWSDDDVRAVRTLLTLVDRD